MKTCTPQASALSSFTRPNTSLETVCGVMHNPRTELHSLTSYVATDSTDFRAYKSSFSFASSSLASSSPSSLSSSSSASSSSSSPSGTSTSFMGASGSTPSSLDMSL
eukprot:TRINITY_DN2709_c0_g1_i4.p1 TRINITY_DN2709_c0_g1~~TRINITY_DN2709_c0_g1_i4.p1  ORF type:complete len:107 (+),score=2.65 TRINITY_DN2709_c0_g1_i4:104-424(+)